MRRSVPQDIVVDGVVAKTYTALQFSKEAPLHAELEVTKGSRDSMLRVIIYSKALTNNHHVALLEYDDGTYEFITLAPESCANEQKDYLWR